MFIPSPVFRGHLNVCQLFCALILLCLHQVTVSSIVVFDHVFLSPDVAPVLCHAQIHKYFLCSDMHGKVRAALFCQGNSFYRSVIDPFANMDGAAANQRRAIVCFSQPRFYRLIWFSQCLNNGPAYEHRHTDERWEFNSVAKTDSRVSFIYPQF